MTAASVQLFSISAMRLPSSESGQWFPTTHDVASLLAASSSSAAANMATSFSRIDAENRLSAPLTCSRTVVALISQCSAVRSLSTMNPILARA